MEGTEGLHPEDHWSTEEDLSENVLQHRPIDKMAWPEDIKSVRQKEETRRCAAVGRMQDHTSSNRKLHSIFGIEQVGNH